VGERKQRRGKPESRVHSTRRIEPAQKLGHRENRRHFEPLKLIKPTNPVGSS
jgi:hypothetical protein